MANHQGNSYVLLAFQFRSDTIPLSLLKLQQNLYKVNETSGFAFPPDSKIKHKKVLNQQGYSFHSFNTLGEEIRSPRLHSAPVCETSTT